MYDKVVVPADGGAGSANSVFVADCLARRWDARATLVSYVHAERRRDERLRLLTNLAAPYGDRVDCKVSKLDRAVNEELAATLENDPDQLVVMSSWGRSRSTGLLESQAESLLAEVGAPILLVGPSVALDAHWPGDSHRQVLVTTDGSRAAESAGLAAVDWAQELEQPLSVVTVLERSFLRRGRPRKSANGAEGFARQLDELGESSAAPVIIEGSKPALEVCNYAEEQGASLLVVASRGRWGESRALLGSVAMSIVHRSPAPVLIVSGG